jgi:hypothetical protein
MPLSGMVNGQQPFEKPRPASMLIVRRDVRIRRVTPRR